MDQENIKHPAYTVGWVATLSQLAFPRESSLNLPWEKSRWTVQLLKSGLKRQQTNRRLAQTLNSKFCINSSTAKLVNHIHLKPFSPGETCDANEKGFQCIQHLLQFTSPGNGFETFLTQMKTMIRSLTFLLCQTLYSNMIVCISFVSHFPQSDPTLYII